MLANTFTLYYKMSINKNNQKPKSGKDTKGGRQESTTVYEGQSPTASPSKRKGTHENDDETVLT